MKKALFGVVVLGIALGLLLFGEEPRPDLLPVDPLSPSGTPVVETPFTASTTSKATPAAERTEIGPTSSPECSLTNSFLGRVQGTVYGGDASPAPFLYVELLQKDRKEAIGVIADENGKFSLTVPKGLWVIAAGIRNDAASIVKRWPDWKENDYPDGFHRRTDLQPVVVYGRSGGSMVIGVGGEGRRRNIAPLDGIEQLVVVEAEKTQYLDMHLHGRAYRVEVLDAESGNPLRVDAHLLKLDESESILRITAPQPIRRYANRDGTLFFWDLDPGFYSITPVPSGYITANPWPLRIDLRTTRSRLLLYALAKIRWKFPHEKVFGVPIVGGWLKRYRVEDGEEKWQSCWINAEEDQIEWPQEQGDFTFRFEPDGYSAAEMTIQVPAQGYFDKESAVSPE